MKTNKLQYKIPFFQVRMKEKKLVKEIIVVSLMHPIYTWAGPQLTTHN